MGFKWSKEMLEDIVLTKRMKSNTLEFKSGEDLNNVMKSNNNNKNIEFSKDISAMANSNGGDIIYGISEEKKNDKSVAGSFSFVERNFLIDSIEQKLNSLIIPKIDNIEIIPIDFSETEMVVIISIPESYTAHQAKNKKYYKRFGFSVEPMEDWEVKDVINRGLKPEVELIFSAVKDNNYLSINNITYGCYDINIKVHNKGKVSANYLNCFIEIEKNLKEYILGTYNLTETSSEHIQIMFDNKQENRIKIGNEWVFFPTVYDPILPSVIKNIGTIKVKKSLLNTHSLLTCQVSTESTCNVFYIYTDEIPKEK